MKTHRTYRTLVTLVCLVLLFTLGALPIAAEEVKLDYIIEIRGARAERCEMTMKVKPEEE